MALVFSELVFFIVRRDFLSKQESLVPLKGLLFSFHATNTIILSFLPLYLKYKELNGTEIEWVLAVGPITSIFTQNFWVIISIKLTTLKRIMITSIIV